MRRIRVLVIVLAALTGVGLLVGVLAGALFTTSQNGQGAISVFGNLNGHFPVPIAGSAVDTSSPDHVIGDGTPASCTSAAVVQAVAARPAPRAAAAAARSTPTAPGTTSAAR